MRGSFFNFYYCKGGQLLKSDRSLIEEVRSQNEKAKMIFLLNNL